MKIMREREIGMYYVRFAIKQLNVEYQQNLAIITVTHAMKSWCMETKINKFEQTRYLSS